jgi:FHS family L-fucose permease-like MFS transporter
VEGVYRKKLYKVDFLIYVDHHQYHIARLHLHSRPLAHHTLLLLFAFILFRAMAGGGLPISVNTVEGGFLTGRKLIFPLFLVICLFFLWGFSYGLLDVLNSHFQTVLDITKLQSTGLQVMYFGGGYFFFSPVAAEVLKRMGYKITILMGLSFYSVGAIMFWPTAHFSTYDNRLAAFGGFLVCTLVIACGLATLETAANS